MLIHTRNTQKFAVLEFGASYNDGGIGSFVQPLIGERIFGTFTHSKLAGLSISSCFY